jgi:TonB-dependent SusC/RagA subfamily outer membrane receptor
MDDYPNAISSNILTFLQGRVPGLYIAGEQISIRGAQGAPLILLDGFERQVDEIINIPLIEIDKIEVLKDAANTAVFGLRGGNGVIAIYTKRGENNFSDVPLFHIISKSIEGFAKSREFYVPDYEEEIVNPSQIDHRATVFWAPNLIPDSTGTCSTSFFNSDDTGNIAILVQGILNNGKPGLASTHYHVRRE